ncbi:MAG: hypothetical protein WC312_03825 [Candidatus Omnitrophota bacterium]|jgi:hypothetical protein
MPKIPQATNQTGINVGATPRMDAPEIGLGAAKKSEQAQSEVVQAIAQAEDVLVKVRDFRQTTEAQNYALERLSSIKSAADQDIDFDSSKYETEIDKVGQEAAKTLTGQLAREEFMANFQRQATAVKWGIRNDFRARELQSIDASIGYQGQQIIDNYGGMNDAEKMASIANYRRSLENAVKIGLYNSATAEAKYAKFQKDIIKGSVDYGILNNPQETLAELQKGNDGAYPGLTQSERIDFIKEAETRIEKLNNQQKEAIAIARNQRESELVDAKIAGTLTVPMVKKERELENISTQFADSMIKALERPKKKTVNTTFNNLALDILNPDKKEKDIRNDLLNKNAIGELNDQDYQILNTFFRGITKETIDKAMPQKTWLQRLFNNGKDKGLRQEIITQMFKQYMQKISQGDDPGKAVTDIITLHLDNHLAEQAKYPNRQYAINQETQQRIYSDDNGVTWRDEKTGELIK